MKNRIKREDNEERIVGTAADLALLTIDRYLIKLENLFYCFKKDFNLTKKIEKLVKEYDFVDVKDIEGFKKDLKSGYYYLKQKRTNYVKRKGFNDFKNDNKRDKKFTEDLSSTYIINETEERKIGKFKKEKKNLKKNLKKDLANLGISKK